MGLLPLDRLTMERLARANIADHPDVAIGTLTNGDVLVWNSTGGYWENQAQGGGSHNLGSHTDVDPAVSSSPADGQILIYDGVTDNRWEGRTLLAADIPTHQHSGADITSGAVGVSVGGTGKASWNVGGVVYASGTTTLTDTGAGAARSVIYTDDGAGWATVSAAESGTYYLRTVNGVAEWSAISAGALNDLTDVTITSPTEGQYLRKSAGNWVNATLDVEDSFAGPDDTILATRSTVVTWDTLVEDDIPSLTATWVGSVVWSKVSKTGSSLADLATRAISDTTGTLAVNRGGTAKTSWNVGGLVYASAATTFQDTGAGLQGAIAYMPDASSWDTVQAPASGIYVLVSDNRVVDWSSAGTIGGSVSATYIPYASSANTLANSPLFRTTSTLVQGDCDLYLHSEIDHYLRIYTYGDNTGYFCGYGSGGTKAAPTAANTQWVLMIQGVGYDGASWTTGAQIGMYASTQWDDAPAEHSMYIQFATRNTSGALTGRWRISEGGTFHPIGASYNLGASSARVGSLYMAAGGAINFDGGESQISGIKQITGRTSDGLLRLDAGSSSGYIYLNYSQGASGGVRIYDGASGLVFYTTATAVYASKPMTVSGGYLLVDGTDSEVPSGSIGFAESGGSFWMSGRHNLYFVTDNDGNAATTVHGFYWQDDSDPPDTKMSLAYNTTVGDFVLDVSYAFIYSPLYLVGTQPAGNSNLSFIAFYANDGSTRTGYIGEASAGDRDIHIYADVGDIQLNAPSGSVQVTSITATTAYGFTIQPSVGASAYRAYGYQSYPRLDLYRAEGTPGSETGVSASTIGEIRFYGYDGAAYVQGAGILAYATTTWDDSPAEHSTRLIFYTREGTGALTARWQIQPNGYMYPSSNSAYDLGAIGYKVRILYVNEISADDGSAGDPSYYFDTSSTTGLYYSSGIAFSVAGTAVAAVRAGKFIPMTSGYDLGDTTYRWDAYLQNAIVYGQTYPGGGIFYPASSPDHRDVTGSLTINWNNNQVQTVSMGAGTLTIYVDNSSNMQIGGTYHIVVFGPSTGSQTLNISGVDIWVGTTISSLSMSADEVVSVNFIKLRNRADDADLVIGVTVLDQDTVPF